MTNNREDSTMNLILEIKETVDKTTRIEAASGGSILLAPMVDEDYFIFRVRLNDAGQAILGFEKFSTVGIGFAQEKDWNTNLPYDCATEQIFSHIAHNKGDEGISDEDVKAAIAMVQSAARRFKGK